MLSGPAQPQTPAQTPTENASATYLLHGKNPLMDCLRRHAIVGKWKARVRVYHLRILARAYWLPSLARVQIDEMLVDSIRHQDESLSPSKKLHSSNANEYLFDDMVRNSLLGALALLVLLALAIGLVDHWLTRRRCMKSGAVGGRRSVNGPSDAHVDAHEDCAPDAVAVQLDFYNGNALDAPSSTSPARRQLADNADALLLLRSPEGRRDDRS